MQSPFRTALVLAGSLIVVLSSAARAQAPNETRAMPVNAWLSLGAGPGHNEYKVSTLAAQAGAWLSVGPFVGGARVASTDVSGLLSSTDEKVQDQAALVGLRTAGRRAFLLGAVGYGHVEHMFKTCSGGGVTPAPSAQACSEPHTDKSGSGLAYSAQANANYRFIGVSLETFGVATRGILAHSGLIVAVQLGWFGQ